MVPQEAKLQIFQGATYVAEDFLSKGVYDNESQEPALQHYEILHKFNGEPILGKIVVCFFMGEYILKVLGCETISEDEYANRVLDGLPELSSN